MPRLVRKSHGLQCQGTLAGSRCTRRRDGTGQPVWMNRPCAACGEQRCKKHCACSRRVNTATTTTVTTAAPRTSGSPSSSSSSSVSVPAPVGRASPDNCEFLQDASLMINRVCADLKGAREAELASYMYDQDPLHKALLKRLQEGSFKLNVYIDQAPTRRRGLMIVWLQSHLVAAPNGE